MLLNKVLDTLLKSCDQKIPSIMLLLDLGAAFDTVDHDKLLYILRNEIGIEDSALSWFSSFLKGRFQTVKIGDARSSEETVQFGVPQGSILGPRLFNLYIRFLYKYIEHTRFEIEGFADDHQLMKKFVITMQPIALGDNISSCLSAFSSWMRNYFLCLNENKTKILIIAPPSIRSDIHINGVMLNDSCIRFVDSAKNLGIVLDNTLNLEAQIDCITKSCFATIRKLSKVRSYFTSKHLQQLVSSHILLPMDYCNSIYFGLKDTTIQKLQRVQNCAARLVHYFSPPHGIPTDNLIANLHWLKINLRIVYKALLMVHKCLNNNAPEEVIALLHLSESHRSRRLIETQFRSSYGACAFSHSGPKLWNLLPADHRQET